MSENLHIAITGDNQGFINALNGARAGVRATAREVEQSGGSIEQMFSRIKIAATGALAGFSAKAFIQQVVQIRGQFQQLEAAFGTLLGSAEKAKDMMSQMTDLAARTPFDLQGVADGARQLLAYGVAADEVTDTLTRLGDIAAGLSIPLNDLVYLYGTTITQGRMYTQDLRQFMGRGIPLAEELAKQFGVTKDKVGELVSAGKVGAEEFKKAIKSMSDAGGQFGGLMEAQSKTITGQIANIEDSIDMMFNNIGKQSEGIINGALGVVSDLVENYETVGKVLAGLVATYGTYKAAVMTVTAIESLQAAGVGALTIAETAHYGVLVLVEKAQKLLNATMLSNPYVLVATALAGLVAVMMTAKSQEDLVTEATQQYNNEKDEAIKKEQEHAAEIDKLCQVAGDESLSTDARKAALIRLEQQYPSIFKKYDTEYEKLKHIRDIKLEIAQLDGKTTITNSKNELANVNKRIKQLEQKGDHFKVDAYGNPIGEGRTRQEDAELSMLRRRRTDITKQISKQSANDYLKDLTGVSNGQIQAQINQRRSLLAKMSVTGHKQGYVGYGGAAGTYSKDELEGQLQILQSELNRRKQIVSDGSKNFTAEARKAYTREKKALNNLRSLTDPKKRANSRMTVEVGGKQKRVSELSADEYADAVTNQQKKVDEAAKKYKGLSGNSPTGNGGGKSKGGSSAVSSVKNEQNDREQAEKDYQAKLKDLQQAREQLEQQLAQSNIDIETDASEKELEQMRLNQEKEMKQLDDEQKQYVDKKAELEKAKAKANGTKYSGTTTLDADEQKMFDTMRSNLRKKHELEDKEYYLKQADAMNDYLKEYGSFEQKRLAITEEYENKIKKATTKGDKLKLQKEKEQQLSSLSYKDISMGIDWSSLFSGIGSMTTDMMVQMQKKLQAYVRTEDYKNADSQTQRDVVQLLQEMRQYIGTDKNTTWETLAKAMQDFSTAITRYQTARDNEKDAVNARDAAKKLRDRGEISDLAFQKYIIAANEAGDATEEARKNVEQLGSTLNQTSDEVTNFTSRLTTALNNLKGWKGAEGFGEVQSAFGNVDQLKGALDSVLPTMADGAAKTLGDKMSTAIGSGLSSVGGGVTKLLGSGLGQVVGIVAQIPKLILQIASAIKNFVTGILDSFTELFKLRWIDDLVDSILGAVSNLINAIFDLPENIYKVLESIVAKGVGGLLNTVIGRIGNILSLGALSSKGPASWFTNSNAKEVEKTIDNLTEQNKNLEQSIEDLTDEMEKARGNSAINISRSAADLQQQTNENYKKIAEAQAGYHDSHHSWNYYFDGFNSEQIQRLSEQIGRAWGGDIWDLSPEEMKILRSNVDMWEQIQDTGKGNYGGRLAEKLNDYIEQAGKLENITNQLYENLTTTTKDDVFDQFLNSLYDLADGSEDVFDDIANNWQQMVNKMVINNLVGERFQKTLESWYEDLAKLNESRTKGEITGDEYRKRLDELKGQYDSYVNSAKSDIETLRQEGIIKATDSNSTYSQNASSGSWQSMGEDTAQELNGRFTALQEAGERISDGIQTMVVTVNSLYGKVDDSNRTLAEMRNLMIIGNGYLEDILSANKKYYELFRKDLRNIERKM